MFMYNRDSWFLFKVLMSIKQTSKITISEEENADFIKLITNAFV